jgi:hypothetical protein
VEGVKPNALHRELTWPLRIRPEMKSLKSSHLMIAIVLLNALAVIAMELSLAIDLSLETNRMLVLPVFLLNAAVAIVGLWRPYRAAWLVYLVASIASMLLFGATTPIAALWAFALPHALNHIIGGSLNVIVPVSLPGRNFS